MIFSRAVLNFIDAQGEKSQDVDVPPSHATTSDLDCCSTVKWKRSTGVILGFLGLVLSLSHQPLTFPFLSLHCIALHQAFEEFATSLVKQEMTNMPRAVYHSALRGGTTRSDQGKTVAGVPNFLLKMYERNKQPGMTPGLAGKLSLS